MCTVLYIIYALYTCIVIIVLLCIVLPTNCSFLSDLGRQAAGTTHASHQWTYADGLGIKEAEETDYIGRREYESECVCMCVCVEGGRGS